MPISNDRKFLILCAITVLIVPVFFYSSLCLAEDKIITQDVSTVDLNTGNGKIDVKFDLKGQGGKQKRLMSTSASTTITPRNDGKIATLSICGDDICDRGNGEYGNYAGTVGSCSRDCGSEVAGDGICSAVETCNSSPADCGSCTCGNSSCEKDKGESCKTCQADCGSCCGNTQCNLAVEEETCSSCPADCGVCPAVCGNGVCDSGECGTCPQDPCDCPIFCGDGICSPGENCDNCQGDCASSANDYCEGNTTSCGDGVCQDWERGINSTTYCALDCGGVQGGKSYAN